MIYLLFQSQSPYVHLFPRYMNLLLSFFGFSFKTKLTAYTPYVGRYLPFRSFVQKGYVFIQLINTSCYIPLCRACRLTGYVRTQCRCQHQHSSTKL